MEIDRAVIDEVFPNNPLRKVAFEARFPFNLSVNHHIYEIQAVLKNDYPLISRTITEIEKGAFKNIYIFTNEAEDQEIQVGEDILEITFLQYDDFESFSNQILECAKLVFDKFSIDLLTRVGLRYINIIDELKVNNIASMNKFVLPLLDFKSVNEEQLERFTIEVLLQKPNCLLNRRSLYLKNNIEDEENNSLYILDIDAFTDENLDSLELEQILKKLHNEIKLDFSANITEEYKQRMRQRNK